MNNWPRGAYFHWRGRDWHVVVQLPNEDALEHGREVRLQELFIFGQQALLDGDRKQKVINYKSNSKRDALLAEADRVYSESIESAGAAVALFFLAMEDVIHKDVRKLICSMVWETRNDPALWGVKLDCENDDATTEK